MNVSPSREELERLQSELLDQLLRAVLPANEFYRGKYAGADLERIDSLKQLRTLPFTTKSELVSIGALHSYSPNLGHHRQADVLARYRRVVELVGRVLEIYL